MDNDDGTDGTLRVQMVAKFGEASMKDPVHKGLFFDSMQEAVDAIQRLAARVAELEAGGIRYTGTWGKELAYSRNWTTTHAGSLWIAIADAVPAGVKPGTDAGAAFWRLTAKGGLPVARPDPNLVVKPKKVTTTTVTGHDPQGRISSFVQSEF